MEYIIGIDGGGTTTTGILATETGEQIAKVQSGPSNYHVVGKEKTSNVLKEIVSELLTQIKNTPLHAINFCLGMAGLGREEDRIVIGQVCDEIGVNKTRILTHDAHIALVGGTGKQEGVIVISGTGSIVYGIDMHGVEKRAGGWGYLLGDEGSGYDIAMKGLQAVARAADKRDQPTQLTEMILNRLRLDKPSDLIRWIHASERDAIAQLSLEVFKATEMGDLRAIKIIDTAFNELACAVETVVKQLELTHPFGIVLSGGNLIHQTLLSNKLSRWIEKEIIGSSVLFPKYEPVYGAVLLAKAKL